VYPLLQVQLIIIELPSDECVYAGHWLHVDSSISPVSVEYLPWEHSEHDDDPFTSLYVPAIHAAHAAPSGPVYPLLQMQSDTAPLPTRASALAGQEMQASDPGTDLYLPAVHCEQGPPSGPDEPALQMQSDTASLPAGASEFAVHAEHVLSAVAPLAAEYFPAPQSVHASLPLPALYLPAAHASHPPAPSLVCPASQAPGRGSDICRHQSSRHAHAPARTWVQVSTHQMPCTQLLHGCTLRMVHACMALPVESD